MQSKLKQLGQLKKVFLQKHITHIMWKRCAYGAAVSIKFHKHEDADFSREYVQQCFC